MKKPKLRIAILTTDTLHHRYFLKRVYEETSDIAVVVLNLFETKSYPWRRNARRHFLGSLPNLWKGLALNPYLQPNLENRIDAYEKPHFFPDGNTAPPKEISSHEVYSVNDDDARDLLQKAEPDLILIYGTGLVKAATFSLSGRATINAHGGKIPGYRGLDTNLWAVLEGRAEDMTATLHQVDEGLDTGPVYMARPINRATDLSLITLRYHTAVLCTEMFIELVAAFSKGDPKPETQDLTESRYFGPMPWLLKRHANKMLKEWATANDRKASR
jgi:folate-dependent phosphoribosylglycinamide formyltransferase PurN